MVRKTTEVGTGLCLVCDDPTSLMRNQVGGFRSTFAAYCSDACRNRATTIHRGGLTVAEFRLLTASGRCPLCNRKIKKWHIDHNHKTGEVYGVTCSFCNEFLLAGSRHDPEIVDRLVAYLANPPARIDGVPRFVPESRMKKGSSNYARIQR